MSHSASEIFTMQLARAAGKQANKFLRARGLQKSDRDDVIGAAMLWCWANRDNYSLTTTLETWFMNAIRDAYKEMQRSALPPSDDSIDSIGGTEDPTYDIVAAESSARALIDNLPPLYKKIALLTMQGYTKSEMMGRGIPHWQIQDARARIRQLRRLVPDESRSKRMIQTATADGAVDRLPEIDVALEQLDFAPPAGKDCPPCWRCMWFEGFMPLAKRETRMDIEDREVREAVKSTEARKIEIAQQVRSSL